jgi:uncharacterized protein YecE (DUF72 family)
LSKTVNKTIWIGCQSWGYDDWITPVAGPHVFYPPGTKKLEMLEFYSKVFSTVEVDATVYGIPPSSTLKKWCCETPSHFTFSLKTPRKITHEGALSAETIPLMHEFVDRVSELREKLGVILIQLPPHFDASRENAQKVRSFLAELPAGLKYAVEFRHTDWFVDWTYQELEKKFVALALVDGPWIPRETVFNVSKNVRSEFAYLRLMNTRDLQKFDHIVRNRNKDLDLWVDIVNGLSIKDLYIYIDNYFEGFAPGTAARLQERLGIESVLPANLIPQRSLFE